MAKSAAWQRKEGKNPKGGLNAKGRASYNKATGGNLKPPVKAAEKAARRAEILERLGLTEDEAKLILCTRNAEPVKM